MERMPDVEIARELSGSRLLRTLARSRVLAGMGAIAAAALLVAHGYCRSVEWRGVFWDAHIYAGALARYAAGANAYSTAAGQNLFVYPPVTLLVAGWLRAWIPAGVAWWGYVALYAASVVLLVRVLVRDYLRQPRMTLTLGFVLLACAPSLAGADALLSGNISLPCYALALVAAVPGIRRGRWRWLYIVVAAIATIKVTFLLLLLLPLLAGRRQATACLECSGVVAAVYVAQWGFAHRAFEDFLHSLNRQAYTGFDDGFSVFHYVRDLSAAVHLGPPWIPFAAALLFVGLVCGGLAWLRARLRDVPEGLWLSLIVVAIAVCNPRMKVYDVALGALPGFALLAWSLETLPSAAVVLAVLLPTPFLVAAYDLQGASVLLWMAALLGGATAAWQKSCRMIAVPGL